ncbi:MAG: hypothetical protein JSW17_03075 [Candidatus Omnitrophota bacterium]|nr:MAG: hypothetical protein JSW17_03075 [Candidatus Omnitrophota bacterium]
MECAHKPQAAAGNDYDRGGINLRQPLLRGGAFDKAYRKIINTMGCCGQSKSSKWIWIGALVLLAILLLIGVSTGAFK